MALPSPSTPVYTVKIPSTKENYKFRPFLVKEEKALLMAQQSEDQDVMVDTLKTIIDNCSKSKIDVDKLATFDIEYLFTQIRAKSVGEVVELMFFCDVCEDDKAAVKLPINVAEINVKFTKDHNKKIELFDDVGMIMKYPGLSSIVALNNLDENDADAVISVIADCIDMIYQGEEIHYAKDSKKEELVEFINNLTPEQFQKVQKFFETMPKYEHHVQYKCPLCSRDHNKYFSGISSFF